MRNYRAPTSTMHEGRRRVREAYLSSVELDECLRSIPRWSSHVKMLPPTSPIILTYSTRVPAAPWLLGLSAAAHGLPLVVAGLGAPGWAWYEGGSQVIIGTRRAAQLLYHLAPEAAVVATDSGDTIIANPPRVGSRTEAAIAHALGQQQPSILLGAECRSWPKCYRKLYTNVRSHQDCWARSASCYVNGGMALASTAALVPWADEMARMLFSYRKLPLRSPLIGNIERTNNQAILHRLVANHSMLPFRAMVDDANTVFLSLNPCKANESAAVVGPFRYCSERAFHPHKDLSHGRDRGGDAGVFFGRQQPLLLHSNGDHVNLQRSPIIPLLERIQQANDSKLDVPVLLLDASSSGRVPKTCSETTLRELIRSSAGGAGGGGAMRPS